MKVGLLSLSVLVLTACGADDPPIRPSVNTTVSVGSDGMRTSTGVVLRRGPVSAGVAF
ncbi:hypothetical protein [Marivita sp. S2033]|uniref:hypothetical protein n=1 Tax=Marivita sp. S2033 TaxID=3373187 RepID=UPI003982D355